MNVYSLTGTVIYSIGMLFFFFWLLSSALEREWKAFRRSIYLVLPILAIFVIYISLPVLIRDIISVFLAIIATCFLSIYIAPTDRIKSLDDRDGLLPYDERDVIFARWRYKPGTDIYKKYYSEHPELEKIDNEIRRKPLLFENGGKFYDPVIAAAGFREFNKLSHMSTMADGDTAPDKKDIDPEKTTIKLKQMILALGAYSSGVAPLNPSHIYTHVGRGPEPWGKKIELNHTHAIAFAVEMDYYAIRSSPSMATVLETGRRYVEGAIISITMARIIRSLGYSARAHIEGSNYQAVLPPIAEEAGLGEIGRIGILMTENLGPRIRLGLVTTDMPLIPDKQVVFGALEFCEKCKKCADACPSGALPKNGKVSWRGTEMWRMNPEACYRTWRSFGTDCAICVSVCPFSKPHTPIHGLVRSAIKHSNIVQYPALLADDFFYGKGEDYLKGKLP